MRNRCSGRKLATRGSSRKQQVHPKLRQSMDWEEFVLIRAWNDIASATQWDSVTRWKDYERRSCWSPLVKSRSVTTVSIWHLGVKETLENVRNRLFWINFKDNFYDCCRRCDVRATNIGDKGPWSIHMTLEVRSRESISLHPQSDGIVERMNKTHQFTPSRNCLCPSTRLGSTIAPILYGI